MFCLKTLSEELECRIHNLLTSLALDSVETEDTQLFFTLFVWTLDKTVKIFAIWNPVKALSEKVFAPVV